MPKNLIFPLPILRSQFLCRCQGVVVTVLAVMLELKEAFTE